MNPALLLTLALAVDPLPPSVRDAGFTFNEWQTMSRGEVVTRPELGKPRNRKHFDRRG